jgi:putative transcriptional regulator
MRHLAAFLFFLLAGAAQAQPTDKPLLLAASPALQGLYSQTALIAVPAGDRHIGFIVNRTTDVKLASLFPDHGPSAKVADLVYFGGPEAVEAIFAVARRNPGGTSVRLFGDIFLAAHADDVDRVIERNPHDARYFAGFVAWEPGELAEEIEAGYWLASDADAAIFFRDDTSTLWRDLVERLAPQRGQGRMHSVSLSPTLAQ